MRIDRCVLLAGFLVLWTAFGSLPGVALGASVVVELRGKMSQGWDPYFPVGSDFTLRYVFAPNALDYEPETSLGFYKYAISRFDVTLGSYGFTVPAGYIAIRRIEPVLPSGGIGGEPGVYDYVIGNPFISGYRHPETGYAWPTLFAPRIESDYVAFGFYVGLSTDDVSRFSDVSLAATAPRLEDFERREFTIMFALVDRIMDEGVFSPVPTFSGTVTSLAVVPAPTAAVTMVGGLLLLFGIGAFRCPVRPNGREAASEEH